MGFTKEVFSKDIFRYYGTCREPLLKRLFRPVELRYIYHLRRCNQPGTPRLMVFYHKLRLRLLSHKTHIQIGTTAKIGEGFYIGHFGRILINYQSQLGRNVNVATGVTIGETARGPRKGVPIIGDDVWIGTNAVVVGKIHIGNNVLIAPLAFVNFDVPDNSIVMGNPGRIIPRENATEGYLQNRV